MDLYPQNSSNDNSSLNNHSQLNSSHEIMADGYTRDGWSFKENKIYEGAMMNFDNTSSVAFCEHVAFLMPWRTIESIKNHGQVLKEDIGLIRSSNGKFEDIIEEMEEETRKVTRRPKKRAIPWTVEEHKLFLIGLQEEGKGEWKTISKKYLPSKTPTQIASHAQKFEKRMHTKTPPEKRRASINDIKLCPEPNFSLESGDFQSNQLGYSLKPSDFHPNQVDFPLNSQNLKPNQATFPSDSQQFKANDQFNFSLAQQDFQQNPFNFSLDFQPNQLSLPMSSQTFGTNQMQSASNNHVHNYW